MHLQRQISSQWLTQNLDVRDTIADDCDELQDVSDSLTYLKDLTGISGPTTMREYFQAPCLPPNGSKNFQRTQSIRLVESSSIIGFLDIYHGFPEKDIFWIAGLYFHQKFQGKAYGPEIATELINQVRSSGYRTIQVNVHLKNWVALRFWFSMGFDRIVQYKGDKALGPDKFASLILELKL